MVLQTEIRLREFSLNDTPFILALLNSQGFLENIGDRKVRTLEDAHNYVVNGPQKSYRDNGYGLYAAELKATGEIIGMCGLVKRDIFEHADIGFAFLPQHFRKGYAFESAQGVLAYAKHTLKMKKVLGITKPENFGSIAVLEKLGLSYEGPFRLSSDEEEGKLFAISF